MKVGDRVLDELSHDFGNSMSRYYIPTKYYDDRNAEIRGLLLNNEILGWSGIVGEIINSLDQDIKHESR